MTVTGKTLVYGIIGDPVGHSLSPVMQNAALAAAGIDGIYVPFRVSPDRLADALHGLRSLGVWGFNVTIPHKIAILPWLDSVSPEAQTVGAVNTVVVTEGRLAGHNTDGAGFIRSLSEDLGMDPCGVDMVVIGAGGAARSAVYSLCAAGARRVTILNRTAEKAVALAERIAPLFPNTALAAGGLDLFSGIAACAQLVVNTTSGGMAGGGELDVDLSVAPPGLAVYDMVYAPPSTPLLAEARRRGLACANGLGMLVGQGEIAFSLWTGMLPPKGVMRDALRRHLPEITIT